MTELAQMTAQVLDGKHITADQFQQMVISLTNHTYDEAQLAAWLMAVRCKGLSPEETSALTMAMVTHNDDMLDCIVDKHSTGGVGDSVTFLALPIVCASGIPIVKLSGKMLGFTGGTVDKLLSIPGIVLNKSPYEIQKQVKKVGLYIGMQTDELCPADKIMYELRDRTGSIASIPLIASSILSKKFSTGAKNIVIDLKYGNGAFMKDRTTAQALADYMSTICDKAGIGLKVIFEEANEPLSSSIGTAIEIKNVLRLLDAAECYDDDDQKLLDIALDVAAAMIELAVDASPDEARKQARKALTSKKASEVFRAMINAQNGDLEAFNAMKPSYKYDIRSEYNGLLRSIDTAMLGRIINDLSMYGNDNHTADPSFGAILYKRPGDKVKRGDAILRLCYNENQLPVIDRSATKILNCFQIERMRV